jgi:hypothetical protein
MSTIISNTQQWERTYQLDTRVNRPEFVKTAAPKKSNDAS